MQDPEELYIYYCAMPRSGTNGKIGVKQINFLGVAVGTVHDHLSMMSNSFHD